MVTRRERRGFTLVELLVVIAIIGILIALLLPALNTVRESARRSTCSANEKQLTLAINAYLEANRTYPPGAYFGPDGKSPSDDITQVPATGTDPATSVYSFLVKLLPHIEHGHVYSEFDFTKGPKDATAPTTGDSNFRLAQTIVPIFNCPSYDGPRRSLGTVASSDQNLALTNYKTYGATTLAALQSTIDVAKSDGDGGGIHPYGKVRALQTTSQTIFIVETKEEELAAWVDGTTSCLYGFRDAGALGTPLTVTDKTAINNWSDAKNNMYNYSDAGTPFQAGAMKWGPSSNHGSLVIHSYGDTNTRSINNEVDPKVYEAMITRSSNDNSNIGDFFSE